MKTELINTREINIIKESILESINKDNQMTVTDLKEFMSNYVSCPNCGQHYIVKDNIKHTNVVCKKDVIIRECLDCGTVVVYNKVKK